MSRAPRAQDQQASLFAQSADPGGIASQGPKPVRSGSLILVAGVSIAQSTVGALVNVSEGAQVLLDFVVERLRVDRLFTTRELGVMLSTHPTSHLIES